MLVDYKIASKGAMGRGALSYAAQLAKADSCQPPNNNPDVTAALQLSMHAR